MSQVKVKESSRSVGKVMRCSVTVGEIPSPIASNVLVSVLLELCGCCMLQKVNKHRYKVTKKQVR